MSARHIIRWLLAGAVVTGMLQYPAIAAAQDGHGQDIRPLRDPVRPRIEGRAAGSIAGRIVSADDERPLRRVQVRAESNNGAEPRATLTDEDGRYQLSEVAPGPWTVTLSKAGYARLMSGQRRPGDQSSPVRVTPGKLTAFDAALVRGAAMTGTVIDELGDPIAGAAVQALRARFIDGERRLTTVASDQTDDTGAFRLHSLPSGDYYVTAQLRDAGPEETSAMTSTLPTFFPGTSNLGEARRVAVRPGDERSGINFGLPAGRAVRVSGVVTDAAGRAADEAAVQLIDPGDGSVVGHPFGNFGMTHDGGRFTMLNVSPGSYLIAAIVERPNSEPEKALAPVIVSNGDVTDLSLVTAPAATITGTVLAATGASLPRELRAQIQAHAAQGTRATESTTLTSTRPFVLTGVAGVTSFTVDGLPKGWAVQHIEIDGNDVIDGTVDIKPASHITARVTLTNKTTFLDGVVMAAAGAAAANDTAVLIFASNPVRWTVPSRFVALVRTDTQGRFKFEGLPPGDYLAVATSDVDEDDLLDADLLLRERRGASAITLVEGTHASLTLTAGADR